MWKNILKKKFFKKIFFKNFFEKKIFVKKSKNTGRSLRVFSHFCVLHLFGSIAKKKKNAKKMAFLSFFRVFENDVQRIHPRVFAVKGGSHPGKNPPIYTVLNAAFSCAKTLCRGSQCTTRARPYGDKFFRKKIFSSQIFVLKILKKNF